MLTDAERRERGLPPRCNGTHNYRSDGFCNDCGKPRPRKKPATPKLYVGQSFRRQTKAKINLDIMERNDGADNR